MVLSVCFYLHLCFYVCVLLLLVFRVDFIFIFVLSSPLWTGGTGQVQSMKNHGLRSAPPNFQVLDDATAGV